MNHVKGNTNTVPHNLASLIRGLYGRVARQLKVDPSYVSRVARGERRSDDIEASLERELHRIMKLVSANRDGVGHNGHRDGAGRDGHKASSKTKTKKKVLSRSK